MPQKYESVTTVAISPKDNTILAGNKTGAIFVYKTMNDTSQYTLFKKISAHRDMILRCKYSRDGKYFLTTSADGKINIWAAQDCSLYKSLEKHTDWVWDATFSNDSKFVVSCSSDKTASLWDVELKECRRVYNDHTNTIMCVDINE